MKNELKYIIFIGVVEVFKCFGDKDFFLFGNE